MISATQAVVMSMLLTTASLADDLADMTDIPYVNVVYICHALKKGILMNTCVQEEALYREVIKSNLWSRSLVKARRECTRGLSLPTKTYKDVYFCLAEDIIKRSKIRLRRWRDDED